MERDEVVITRPKALNITLEVADLGDPTNNVWWFSPYPTGGRHDRDEALTEPIVQLIKGAIRSARLYGDIYMVTVCGPKPDSPA